jgi:two-component system alkaline phosphatase synthesis response regulator PhoP
MTANTSFSGSKRILCANHNEATGELMRLWLRLFGYEPVITTSIPDTLEQASVGGFALYILDTWLGQGNGIDLCKRIRASDRDTPIMFYSGEGYQTDIQRALDAGAQEYVVKPDFEKLELSIDRLIH